MTTIPESTPNIARDAETEAETENSPGRHVNSFAIWQPDKDVQQCLNCQRKFTIFLRRHHCRCCGGVFCGYCVSKFATYDRRRVKIVSRPGWGEEVAPYRTCDACYENLMSLGLVLQPRRPRLRDYIDSTDDDSEMAENRSGCGGRLSPVVVKSSGTVERVVELGGGGRSRSNIDGNRSSPLRTSTPEEVEEELSHCPICNIKLCTVGDGSEEATREHVERCIACAEMNQQHRSRAVGEDVPTGSGSDVSSSPTEPSLSRSPAAKNRMLVYRVAATSPTMTSSTSTGEKDGGNYRECPICFEEMKPGDKVGRLECLCVFHYKCIKRWFVKRSQRLKPDDPRTVIGKNFCPLHDAIY